MAHIVYNATSPFPLNKQGKKYTMKDMFFSDQNQFLYTDEVLIIFHWVSTESMHTYEIKFSIHKFLSNFHNLFMG